MVRQRSEDEVVVIQVAPQQALGVWQVQILLQHATDENLRQEFGIRLHDQIGQGAIESRSDLGRIGQTLIEELPCARLIKCFLEQSLEVQYLYALVAQLLAEGVMLLPSTGSPHDIVEEQVLNVRWGEASQLQTGTVHDDRLKLAYL